MLPFTLLLLPPAVAFTIYIVGLCVYRVFFHPLARYPGPLLAKITDLYSAYHAWKGDRHLEFARSHERYGPVVRFGPNSVSFNSNSALKEIYGFKTNVRKSDFYSAFPSTKDAYSTHSAIDKAQHARKRRVLSHAFSDAALKSMENHILAHIRTFCETLGVMTSPEHPSYNPHETKGWTPARNISDQANYLTFDIMGDLCFGKSFNMLSSPTNRFAIDLIGNAAHRHLICGTYLPLHEYHLDKILFRKIAAGRTRYMQYSKSQAGERTKLGLDVDRKDFFYHLLQARDPETGNGFSSPELWGESNLLIIAGSDTTSTALAATFYYLVHHPSTLSRACAEIRSTFSSTSEIHSGTPLTSLAYLRACIDEAMRLSPSVGGLLPRTVLPGGLQLSAENVLVPAGTTVGVPHYTLHHNARYFPEPDRYDPSRWIVAENGRGEEGVRLAQSAFCPFSVGPRGCIGKGMAYLELMATLARVLFVYDVRLAPGTRVGEGRKGEFALKDTFTSMKDGPMVQFRRRDGVEL